MKWLDRFGVPYTFVDYRGEAVAGDAGGYAAGGFDALEQVVATGSQLPDRKSPGSEAE